MNCPKCGNEVKEGMKFCGKCGSPISQGAVNSEPTKVFAPPASSAPRVNRAPAISTSAAPPVYEDFASVAPSEPKKEKKSKKKLWAILIPIVAILVAVAILVPTVIVPWWQGKNAEPVKRRSSSISAGYNTSVALKNDGTVLTAGLDDELKDEVTSWTEIVALDSSGYITAGVRKNGMVCFADNTDTEWSSDKWTGVKNISVSSGHAVGLKKDGTVVAEGNNESGACDVADWTDIVQVEAAGDNTFAVKNDGTVLVAGKKSDATSEVEKWTDIISISASENIVIGLKSDGTVVIAVLNSDSEYDVSDWKNIIAVAVGKNHAIALRSDGTVLTVGDSSNGKLETSVWEKIVDIAAGDEHTIGLYEDGTVVAVGSNDNGQCAVEDWKDIMIPTIEAQDGEGTTASAATSEQKAVLSPKSAVEIYMANKDVWMGEADMYNHDYILADLDFDGVLELISTNFGGSGRFSYNYYYRINIDNRSVVEIPAENENDGGYDYTSINNEPKLYKNKSDGKMFYFATDFVLASYSEYGTSQGKMYYDGSKICNERMFTVATLGANSYANSTDEDIINYYVESVDSDNPISEAEYDKYFSEFENNSIDLNLKWSPIEMGNFNSSDEATQKQLLLEAYQAFSYDGFSFANLKTYDLSDTDATSTTTALSTTLELTQNDLSSLEEFLTVIEFSSFDSNNITVGELIDRVLTSPIRLKVYAYYFDDAIFLEADDYSNPIPKDPLKRFDHSDKLNADNIKWICENIFHVKFDENYKSESSYYYDGFIYREVFIAGDGSATAEIRSQSRTSDGKLKVEYGYVYEGKNSDTWVAVVDMQMIDGEKQWTIYSNECVEE